MSPNDKLDISGTIDQRLASWPAPLRDDAAWGARADAIVAAAQAAPRASDTMLSNLLEPPRLDPEPGEPSAPNVSYGPPGPASGEKVMSQESNPVGAVSKPEATPAPSGTVSKRPSLKELAARASQTGAARTSNLPGSIPPLSEAPPARPSLRTPVPTPVPSPVPSPPPKALEKTTEDSGLIKLSNINGSHAAVEEARVTQAPATSGSPVALEALREEAAKVASLSEAREKKQQQRSGGGAFIGLAVAALGIAAAVAIMMGRGSGGKDTGAQAKKENNPAPVVAAAPPAAPQKIAAAPPTSTSLSIDSLPSAEAPSDHAKPANQAPAGGGTPDEKLAAAPPVEGTAQPAPVGLGPAPTASGKVGDLNSAMAKAVGGAADKPEDTGNEVPAAGGKGLSQNIPEQPSQGSVAAAVGKVMGGAKACVAGADDVSRATITFSSTGSVSSVSVTGWAASNGQSGCVKSALSGANVGPFSKPSFSFPVTIRP